MPAFVLRAATLPLLGPELKSPARDTAAAAAAAAAAAVAVARLANASCSSFSRIALVWLVDDERRPGAWLPGLQQQSAELAAGRGTPPVVAAAAAAEVAAVADNTAVSAALDAAASTAAVESNPVVVVAVRNLVAADNKDLGVAAKAEPAPAVI